MVLLEGMSCGVPFVSFDCPHGPRNIISDCEDGLLVDYLDSQALAGGICKLIENEDLRKRLGNNAIHDYDKPIGRNFVRLEFGRSGYVNI